MAYVFINGLPRSRTLNSKAKIAQLLKSSVPTLKKSNFWVCSIKGRKAYLKFGSATEAENAQQILDGFVNAYNGQEHVFEAEVSENGDFEETEDTTVSKIPVKRKFESSNPHEQLSKVEAEIELIKKQRMLVEEERKLLIEKKKLAILQKLDTTDINQLKLFESVVDKSTPIEIQEALSMKSETASTVPMHEIDSFIHLEKVESTPTWRYLYKVRRVLYIQMKSIIDKYTTDENRSHLRTLWNAYIRNRLAVLLEGKRNLKPRLIIDLYRELYPPSTDEKFIKDLVKTVEISLIAPTGTNGQTANQTGESASGNQKKSQNDEPAEWNAEIDIENDCGEWTDDESKDEPKQDGESTEKASDVTETPGATEEPGVEKDSIVIKESAQVEAI